MCDMTNSLVTHDFYIEMATVKDVKTDDIKKHCLDIVELIKSVNNSPEFGRIQNLEYDINQIGVITFNELIKLYPNLSIEEAITYHVVNNGAYIVIGLYRPFGNKKRFFGGLPASDDYDLCSVLFVYHEIINKVLPIVKISPRPNAEKIKKQLITDLPQVFNTRVYDQTIFKHVAKYEPTVGIRIFFSNLMLINLKKYHIAEVVHSN
jgi:asparagine synthetase A